MSASFCPRGVERACMYLDQNLIDAGHGNLGFDALKRSTDCGDTAADSGKRCG